jgi:DnaJ like chaperone protein
MSVWGKLAGAAAGLAVGGPIGALLGGLAGHIVIDNRAGAETREHDRQIAFTIGIIALGAKMAKADGVVTKIEVHAFKEVFKVPDGDMDHVARIFDLAKQDIAGYESYAKQLDSLFHDNRALLRDVMDGLFHIAVADGILHPKEETYLWNVAQHFGFSEKEFTCIKARHVRSDHRNPYDVLEVAPNIADDELKSRYRKLVAENHPDRLMARGVPAEFVSIATRKLAAINAAYEEITASRRIFVKA